ncbi:hypothetical protein C4572_01125 [Candidatus Parcubacteria bacterium]|nr:MAG: hypothetical protein C4572_01125 [Candidatus Parcubacteria bacterium]
MSTKVGYLGPNMSTFGYIAAEDFFAKKQGESSIDFMAYKSHEEVCLAVGKKEVNYGVVAIENVIDGVVTETIRAIEDVDGHLGLKVWAESVVPIELFYLRKENISEPPKKLLSHAVAIRQCSEFVSQLREDNRELIVEVRDSTGVAAEEASTDHDIVVIASSKACEMYNLTRIYPLSVTDHKNSKTRFWIIGKEHANKTGKDKTCFLINLEQSMPGTLAKTLSIFSDKKINLLLIYPCPIPGKHWEYTFLLEFEGYVTDKKMVDAWSEFRKLGLSLNPPRFIGSYQDITSK